MTLVLGLALGAEPERYTAYSTPFLHKPFRGEHVVSGFYDHRRAPAENDHRQLTAWGNYTWGRAGHAAYDWPMREGTEILAAADGVVEEAADFGPRTCGKNKVDADIRLRIKHQVGERSFHTHYLHLSELEAAVGDRVKAGEVIARSGNTGCSSGPHLHFAVLEDVGLKRPRTVDPYGWDASYADPTAKVPLRHGEWLWLEGEAPLLFRPMGRSRHPARSDVQISGFRGMAWQDHLHPNNEFVELKLNPNGRRRVDLEGWSIRNRAGLVFAFPAESVLRRDAPIRLYSGAGEATERTYFWGMAAGVWNDEGDCVELLNAAGERMHVQHQGRRAASWCSGD